MSDATGPLIVALDYDDLDKVLDLVDRLDPGRCRVKVGKQLFTRQGPAAVTQLVSRGFDVFLDLKFHDIPNTVANAVQAAADLGVWMVNVHASGGARMMTAAAEALKSRPEAPLLTAVTVLTSMGNDDLAELGTGSSAEEMVVRLSKLASESGLDGVVCSAQEAVRLRTELPGDFVLVTPGIRLPGDDPGDQRRIVTPLAARQAGASYLVMGRSITASAEPAATVEQVLSSLTLD